MDWLQQGIAIAILVAIGGFWWKGAWPWIKGLASWVQDQLKIAREDRRQDQTEFLKALERRDAIMERSFKALQDEISKSGLRRRPK